MIGLADCCEALGIVWAFPTIELIDGILDGDLAHDLVASMVDAGVDEDLACSLVDHFQQACVMVCSDNLEAGSKVLFETMRHSYTRLYLTPGGRTPVAPFESAFLFDASGAKGVPTLFVSRTTADVESCMREVGVAAKNARKEPADAIWNEFSYLAFAYGRLAEAMQSEDAVAVDEWHSHIQKFLTTHALMWIPDFMEKTIRESKVYELPAIYSSLAKVSSAILAEMKE